MGGHVNLITLRSRQAFTNTHCLQKVSSYKPFKKRTPRYHLDIILLQEPSVIDGRRKPDAFSLPMEELDPL